MYETGGGQDVHLFHGRGRISEVNILFFTYNIILPYNVIYDRSVISANL